MGAPMLKLHDYVEELEQVLEWITEHEEEIVAGGVALPPDLIALLDRIEGDLTEKVRRIALVILNLTASAKAARAESDRVATLARGYERQKEALKHYLMVHLERAGMRRVETPSVKVRIQKNTRPSIKLASARIPEAFRRVRVEFDGVAAYEALKEANCLPNEPGRLQVDGMIVELRQHLRVW